LYSWRNPSVTSLNTGKISDAGFTLVEILVAIAIMAIMLAIAGLTIPNHDERYWRQNLDQLVGSLNLAQEESAMSGTPMSAQVDSAGWRFYVPNSSTAISNNSSAVNVSGLLPEVYRAQAWHKPVEMTPLQLTLGDEQVMQALQVPIKQENRQALLLRSRQGRFSWSKL
jgi:type II secretion system protein H